MTKIQIIIDDEKSLKVLTCTDVEISQPTPTYQELYGFGFDHPMKEFHFTARDVVADDSPTLISLPDELLLRIRDYNIDTKHQNAVKQTLELKETIESLKAQVRGWELRRDLAMEDYENYQKAIIKMIDRCHMAVAELCRQDGDLEVACYFANKANEEEEE